jgi:hypothetical protein
VWSSTVVIGQERAERVATRLRGRVRDSVRPFSQERLDESLGLAVGTRRIGARATMLDAEGVTARPKGPGVGHSYR